jgi:hypothetical protein
MSATQWLAAHHAQMLQVIAHSSPSALEQMVARSDEAVGLALSSGNESAETQRETSHGSGEIAYTAHIRRPSLTRHRL